MHQENIRFIRRRMMEDPQQPLPQSTEDLAEPFTAYEHDVIVPPEPLPVQRRLTLVRRPMQKSTVSRATTYAALHALFRNPVSSGRAFSSPSLRRSF